MNWHMHIKKYGFEMAFKLQYLICKVISLFNDLKNNFKFIPFGIFARLIFRRFANILGGRIRLIFTGNAMLSPETQELIEIFLCTKICAVYGITETGFGGTATDRMYLEKSEKIIEFYLMLIRYLIPLMDFC